MILIKRLFRNNVVLLILLLPVALMVGGTIGILTASEHQPGEFHPQLQMPAQSGMRSGSQHLLHGKIASLSWIFGQDCQRGLQTYLHTAALLPDAALVGTGWLDPTNGKLIAGKSNNCVSGSLSMDSVVQMIH